MITKEYKLIDGIKVFIDDVPTGHPDYNANSLDKLYTHEEKHFWFITRKEFILKNLRKYIKYDDKIIEIGSGTGNISYYLMKNGYTNISNGDIHRKGLKYSQKYGIKECYQFDILETPFENEFDAVLAFDVIEHIENDTKVLQNIYKMLKPKGKVVITVPAHMWLWSKIDEISKHKRRYSKKQLKQKLVNSGFRILTINYFFISITPLLLFRKMIYKKNVKEIEMNISNFINYSLLIMCRMENIIHKFLPNLFGGSIIAVGEKIEF
ncbi:MAG: class I SAM-dependent methyltransferase [Candidatus Calescibacterium sp.]|nr:class I SAM-dependent methyltransferase [Candidatus Calescibacterium sp.]